MHALRVSLNIQNGMSPNPSWKRPRGRPRKTWVDVIQRDIGTMTMEEAWMLASDRIGIAIVDLMLRATRWHRSQKFINRPTDNDSRDFAIQCVVSGLDPAFHSGT